MRKPENGNIDEDQSLTSPSYAIRRSLAGGLAAACGKTLTAPLERVRIIKQAADRGSTRSVPLLASIYQQDGVRGLWRGNGVNLSRVVPSYAVRFTVFGNLADYADKIPILSNPFICGGIAGTASALASYPLEVIRTRISVSGSIREALSKGGLYAGCSLTVLETTPYAALTLGTYKFLSTRYPARTQRDRLIHGFTAGAVATVICFPLDTLRRNKIVKPESRISEVANGLLKEGGVRRFYRGLGIAVAKAAPTVSFTMMANDYLLNKLGL
jgi:solute carrier family 25 phosphate transporter 23/24/25/41